MSRTNIAVMALIIVTMSGCVIAGRDAAVGVAGAEPGRARQAAVVASPAPVPAIQELTLQRAVELALERRPSMKARYWEARKVEAQARQAGLWANPELQVEVENIGGSGAMSGFDAAETTAMLSQTISIGGDIRRRRAVVEHLAEQADWDYEAARIAVQVETVRRYVEALAADRLLQLAQDEYALAKETGRAVRQRVAAGEASPVEESVAVAPLLDAELNLKQAERGQAAAYDRLSLMWGQRAAQFETLAGNLEAISALPSPESLVQLISSSPEVARWTSEIAMRRAERRLAIAEAIPDINAGGGIRHWNENEETAFVFGVSLPLPVFDRKQGDLLAARHSERIARLQMEEARLQIETQLSESYEQLSNSHEAAEALRERGLPATSHANEAVQQSFEEGKVDFMDVLDAQRRLFELQRRYVRALVNYHIALAEVEALVGQPIPGVKNPHLPKEENES